MYDIRDLKELKEINFVEIRNNLSAYTNHLRDKIIKAAPLQKTGWQNKLDIIQNELLPALNNIEVELIALDQFPTLILEEKDITPNNQPKITSKTKVYKEVTTPERSNKEAKFLQIVNNFANNIDKYKNALSERSPSKWTAGFWKNIDRFLQFIGYLNKNEKSTYGVSGARVARNLFSQFPDHSKNTGNKTPSKDETTSLETKRAKP